MTVTVNGVRTSLNIGCRSFVSVDEFLRLLGRAVNDSSVVRVNTQPVAASDFAACSVKSGDRIQISSTK